MCNYSLINLSQKMLAFQEAIKILSIFVGFVIRKMSCKNSLKTLQENIRDNIKMQ